MVSAGMTCVKYALFIFNLVFFIAGLALIVGGALVLTSLSSFTEFFGSSLNSSAIFVIVVGSVIFIIGFFGCCGAIKENYCMVQTFAALLCLVLILEIAATATAYVLRHQLKDLIEKGTSVAIHKYAGKTSQGVTTVWDKSQREFHCCGAHNYTDWSDNANLNITNSLPWSCCKDEKANNTCGEGALNWTTGLIKDKIYTAGCATKLLEWASHHFMMIGAGAAALAFVELFGVIIACCLSNAIRKEYEVV